ncbi:MAG TPA: hypothetical protein VN451_01155 [Chitinophagaceae bacterium]|nr:hypothetical protein [Chitinophagaceae bacterium]
MAEGQINGHFIIMKSHKDTKETDIPFDGNRQSDQFYIRFKRTPPSLNDNTKWTKHSWKIISVDLVDTLQVIFLQKNLETKKWEEVMYEFIEEKEDYSNLSATLALSDKS